MYSVNMSYTAGTISPEVVVVKPSPSSESLGVCRAGLFPEVWQGWDSEL